MLINLMKFIRGYLKIRICSLPASYSFAPERFINLCSNHDILIWGLENKDSQYEMYISVKGFKKLKPILKKTNTKLKIVERHGLPFFLFKYRKRKMFFIGIAMFYIVIYTLSIFIWEIKIEGNLTRTDDIILDLLMENNVYHGMLKKEIDCEEIERILRSEYNDITWASARIQGTRLLINVQENTDTVIEQESTAPSDIIATKDCIITNIVTRRGVPLVEKGSVVKKGDVLVRGRVDVIDDSGEVADYQYCASDADIFAKTKLEYKDSFDVSYNYKDYTGEKALRYYLKILNKKINIFNTKIGYNEYDMFTDECRLKFGENFYLPIVFGETKIREYETKTNKYTNDEAVALGNRRFQQFCENLIEKGVQIVENNVKIHIGKNSCNADGYLIIIEKTGTRTDTEILTIPERTDTNELE